MDNIVINAHHAMPSGGNVTVAAQNLLLIRDETLTLAPCKYVKISISDTGIGIPPKYINSIFDPFFSTKQTGSGLGLATSYSIVKQHGGIMDDEQLIREMMGGMVFFVRALIGPCGTLYPKLQIDNHSSLFFLGMTKGNAEIYPSGNWRQYSYKAMLAAEAAL